MSENAERPASSRPRIGSKGAADRLEREFPAALATFAFLLYNVSCHQLIPAFGKRKAYEGAKR